MKEFKIIVNVLVSVLCLSACSADKKNAELNLTFTNEILLPHTPARNQGRTQTCWAYTMASMFESDYLMRTGDTVRLSVMYAVRQKYMKQFEQYYYSKGHNQIRGGSLGHSFLWVLKEKGAMPDEAYKGYLPGAKYHDHRALLKKLKNMAEEAVDKKDLQTYQAKAESLLDECMGAVPEHFTFRGIEYTPRSFADSIGLKADDYVELTSFTHHPYHRSFILEVPDNWEHASFYNVSIDSLEACVQDALHQGQTVAWDGDISEEGFSHQLGVAVHTQSSVTQTMRQQAFEAFKTTDDHMMHIVGLAHDEYGRRYYILKNSWGRRNPYQGLVYMSQDYFRVKTVSICIKDCN